MTASSTENPPGWADSKQTWIGRVHDAVLSSGMKVTYRDLTLGEMAAMGELPADLLEIAVAEWGDPGAAARMAAAPFEQLPEKPTKKETAAAAAQAKAVAARIAEVNRHMIAAALVEPKLTVDELKLVPVADLELLSAFINRTATYDAAGRRVGVAPVDGFQLVVEAHGLQRCPPDCPACAEAQRGLATVR